MLIGSTLAKTVMGAAALMLPFAAFASSTVEVAQSSPAVQTAIAAQNSVTANLMRNADILGTAVMLNDDGTPNVTIFVDREAKNVADLVSSLPKQVGNVPAVVYVTEKFRSA